MQKYHDEPKQYKGYLKSALGMDVRAETARGGPTSHTQMSSECDPLRTLL